MHGHVLNEFLLRCTMHKRTIINYYHYNLSYSRSTTYFYLKLSLSLSKIEMVKEKDVLDCQAQKCCAQRQL